MHTEIFYKRIGIFITLLFTSLLFISNPNQTNAQSCSDYSDLYYCEDFDNYSSYQDHVITDGILTHTHMNGGGWDNGGHTHFRVNDYGSEDGAGIGGVFLSEPANQLNIGYFIYYGPDFPEPLDQEEYKALLVVDWNWVSGGGNSIRPRIDDNVYVDLDGNYHYRTIAPCNNGGSGCEYPPLTATPEQDWRDNWPEGNETFRIDDRLGEWMYYEFEVEIGGEVTLYIYTQDGEFSGEYHSVDTHADMEAIGGIDLLMGYWEGASGTSNDTYYKLDFLRLDDEFMGPPSAFLSGGTPTPDPEPEPETAPTCSSFNYSDWGVCSSNSQQSRTVLSSSPNGCEGGSPVTTQSCTYTPPVSSGGGGGGGGGSSSKSSDDDNEDTETTTTESTTNDSNGNERQTDNDGTEEVVDKTVRSYTFSRSIFFGTKDSDVIELQKALNALGFTVAKSGPGSPGLETNYYGPATMKALQRFQAAHGIVASGTLESTGYGAFGPQTRAKLNEVLNKQSVGQSATVEELLKQIAELQKLLSLLLEQQGQ